jgi:23S rRNA pseudouridine2605 synthase
MSLKAKIEAVIYAAEEPVTLAQLGALFQAEALENRRARLAERAVEAAAAASVAIDPGLGWESPLTVAGAIAAEAAAEEAEEANEDPKQVARQRDREVRDEIRGIVNDLIAEYADEERGLEVREIAGGYRMATKAEYHDAVRSFVKSLKPPMKLSLQALETLAVIAYKQPVTAPEVSEIRGVDSSGVLGSLISRKLITTAGRKQVIGRPILYKTTKEFLLRFGLKDLNELPSIEEFEKMAGELAETDEIAASAEQLPLTGADEDELQIGAVGAGPDPGESDLEADPIASVGVSDEGGNREPADLPGISVEPDVKPAHMVDRHRGPARRRGLMAGDPAHLPELESQERLQKIIAAAGICSRRKAEELILAGRVQLNGKIVTELGTKADPSRDHIRVDGKLLQGPERHRYYLVNKPKGYVTTASDPEGRPTVMDLIRGGERVFPVGRLDYASEGLLLMTNDGELANALTRAASRVEKTYLVKISGRPRESDLDQLRSGMMIERGRLPGAGEGRVMTSPAKVRLVREGDNPWYELVLIEGRNREIRKMFEEIGHHAEKIRRVGYGPLVLDVEPGKLRELTPQEVEKLRRATKAKQPNSSGRSPKPERPAVTARQQRSAGTSKAARRPRRLSRPR